LKSFIKVNFNFYSFQVTKDEMFFKKVLFKQEKRKLLNWIFEVVDMLGQAYSGLSDIISFE